MFPKASTVKFCSVSYGNDLSPRTSGPIRIICRMKLFVSLKMASCIVICRLQNKASAKWYRIGVSTRYRNIAESSTDDAEIPFCHSRGQSLHNDVGLGRPGMVQVSEDVVILLGRRSLQNNSVIRSRPTLRHVRDVLQVDTCPDGQ